MATSYNAQIRRDENRYSIQFETSDYDLFKEVEKACQKAVDENKGAEGEELSDFFNRLKKGALIDA